MCKCAHAFERAFLVPLRLRADGCVIAKHVKLIFFSFMYSCSIQLLLLTKKQPSGIRVERFTMATGEASSRR